MFRNSKNVKYYAELETNIRLANKLTQSGEGMRIVCSELGGYAFEVYDLNKARELLREKRQIGNYAVYLSMKKPLVIDGKGAYWNTLGYTTADGTVLNKTREVAKYAKDNNYDGVIFKNIKDSGGRNTKYNEKVGTVYVAFDPTQIKSATDNIGTFNKDEPDIRYSISNSRGKRYHPLNRTQRRFFSSFGVDVVVLPDLPEGANAKILTKSGKLLVSPYAKVSGWELARHEFTHYIKTFYPKAYKGYVDAVKLELGDKWQTEYDRVYKKYEAFAERYPDAGISLDEDVITEEVVAEYAEGFENSDFMKRTAERDLSVAAYIRNALKNLIQRIKAIFTPAELRANRESIEYIMSAKDMWEKAVIEAARSPRTAWKNAVMESRTSISSTFSSDYDSWVKSGRTNGVRLNVGSTSDALLSIGVKNHNIIWDTTKINKSLKTHKYLNDTIMKQIPELIEHPIIIMESKTIPSRLTIFGEVYDGDGLPMMAVIELKPTSLNTGLILEEIKIASTHSRKNIKKPSDISQTQNLINTSKIMYVEPNRKRTDNWLVANRLQLPLHITQYGSINRVSYSLEDVKGNFSYTEPEGEPHAFGWEPEKESSSADGHDRENDMRGDGKVVEEFKSGRSERWKKAKADGHDYFWYLHSEMGILEHIINDFERQGDGSVPTVTYLRNDNRHLKYELRLAENARDYHKAEKIIAQAKLNTLRGLFGDINTHKGTVLLCGVYDTKVYLIL